MVAILLGDSYDEFLATPSLIRFLDSDNTPPVLAVKAPLLMLKYLVAASDFSLYLLPLPEGGLVYAIEIADDPRSPAFVWSAIENRAEIDAVHAVLRESRCAVGLFNELAINVAATFVEFSAAATAAHELLTSERIEAIRHEAAAVRADQVPEALNQLRATDHKNLVGWRLTGSLAQPWDYPTSYYYSNNLTASYLSLADADHGAQQEAVGLWLTDVFAAKGAYLNPYIGPAESLADSRELCDVLLTTDDFSLIIESKALNVLDHPQLPTRHKLHGRITKAIEKGAGQVTGALRHLRLGYQVTTEKFGRPIHVDPDKPIHLIVLVPDLTLLSEADGLGKAFLSKQIQKTGCPFHLLDPTQLLRVVQAATIIEKRTGAPKTTVLQHYLLNRLNYALELDTPNFDILLRED